MPIVSVNIMGGLGNQLFQIATAYAYSRIENGTLQIIHKRNNGNRPVYWDSILKGIVPFLVESIPNTLVQWYETHATMYKAIPNLTNDGIYLNGYLQTSRYFYNDDIKNEIKMFLLPTEDMISHIQKTYAYLLKNKERVVVIHCRRTDYITASDVHGPLTGLYYKKAVFYMYSHIENPLFLLCGDDNSFWNEIQSDISSVFQYESIVLNESDIYTFTLLQQFKHFIMSNSTFIWWCVWLSNYKNVVAPATWFGPHGPQHYEDIYESDWIRM
jgi:hypothetical protein